MSYYIDGVTVGHPAQTDGAFRANVMEYDNAVGVTLAFAHVAVTFVVANNEEATLLLGKVCDLAENARDQILAQQREKAREAGSGNS